ncbi:unnamed protein product [Dovyalis caffra]|uniref:Uncharacterized protein n=1 Tax=Dovyalis caffra TaxID=77055 RepID=A0AAV1RGK5_9ROSI|nr:unnamed protein product [Dovyalis caffra]
MTIPRSKDRPPNWESYVFYPSLATTYRSQITQMSPVSHARPNSPNLYLCTKDNE